MAADDTRVELSFLGSIRKNFEAQKRSAEKAIVQLSDEQLRTPLDANTNSVAVIMKHMAENLRSRFTDFLTSDGEKPDRDRDGEFVDDFPSRDAMLDHWERGWKVLFDTLASLRVEDLTTSVTIRREPHTVIDALHRALAHQGYHVGQITQLARHLAGDNWTTITIPRGGSQAFSSQKLDARRTS
jgi:uncharacterized damage-inducible protein DinB